MQLTPARLSKTIDAAFTKTKNQRQARVKFMRQYVGRFYRNNGKDGDEASKAAPINLIYAAVSTIVPNLVVNDPKAKADTDLLAYRTYAIMHGLAISRVAQRSGLKKSLRGVIADAIFMAGFMKVGEAIGDSIVTLEGVDYNLTEPYMERVSPDDMILDPMARAWDEQAILGNKFRVDVDKLIEIGYGDPDMLNSIAEDVAFGSSNEKASDITKSSQMNETRRYVELAEVWIPAEKRIVTLPYKQGAKFDQFVRSIDYGGPPKGQYHMLGFAEAPDNLLPIAPAGIWYDLHILGNRIARKISRQAERNKRVLAYEDDAEEDVEKLGQANDGETVRVANLDKIKEVEYGGVSEKAYEWMNWIKQNFSDMTGENQLSGTGDAAPTLGQEQIQQANTSVRLGDMQGLVYTFTGEVLSDVGYILHTDPLINLPLVRREGGVETQDYYTPDQRVGEWYEYHITTVPFSMARTDPNSAVRRKLEFATNVIPAAANAAAVLGPGFRIGPFLTSIAREVGIDDADEWLVTPEIQQWITLNMMLSQKTGDPGKAAQFTNPMAMVAGAMGMNPAAPTPMPGQPNPSAMGPTGGISPATEQAQAVQEAAVPNQASTKALALVRGGM